MVPYDLDPSVNQTSPLTAGGVPDPLSSSQHSNPVIGSKLNAGFITPTLVLNMGSDS